MRKSIIDKINNANINFSDEMIRVELIFSKAPIVEHFYVGNFGLPATNMMTIEKYINDFLFIKYEYAGTYISVRDMRSSLKITEKDLSKNKKENLLLYYEFILNMISLLNRKLLPTDRYNKNSVNKLLNNIQMIIEKLNYKIVEKNNYFYIVEKDMSSSAISEIYPELSDTIIEYRRFDLKGNIVAKRAILQTLSLKVEGIESKLKGTTYNPLVKDLKNLYNNLHIRHNNLGENPNNNVIEMDDKTLENWYDITYDITLTALMICKYLDYHIKIDSLPDYYQDKI